MTWPAAMVVVVGLGGVAGTEAGRIERVERVGLGQVDEVGHGHEGRPGGEHVVDRGAGGDLGVGGSDRS